MMTDEEYKQFVQHPTGAIPKGAFCHTCHRLNLRHSTVEGIVVNDAGEILLVKRLSDPEKGWWALPGGYVDWDETVEQAVLREVEEETGYMTEIVRLLGVFSSITRDEDGRQNIGHCFVLRVKSGDAKKQDSEIEKLGWFAPNEIPPLAFDHSDMVKEYLSNKI